MARSLGKTHPRSEPGEHISPYRLQCHDCAIWVVMPSRNTALPNGGLPKGLHSFEKPGFASTRRTERQAAVISGIDFGPRARAHDVDVTPRCTLGFRKCIAPRTDALRAIRRAEFLFAVSLCRLVGHEGTHSDRRGHLYRSCHRELPTNSSAVVAHGPATP